MSIQINDGLCDNFDKCLILIKENKLKRVMLDANTNSIMAMFYASKCIMLY